MKDVEILGVDDFPEMRSMLTTFGVNNITEACRGEEALFYMQEERKESVIYDYLGEEKDGQQVLEEKKERDLLLN